MSFVKRLFPILLLSFISCNGIFDDLIPDHTDLRKFNTGVSVGSVITDQPLLYTTGAISSLHGETPFYRAVVLYFTMWCAVCNSHTDHMRSAILPNHPDVLFVIVDYVSGTLSETQFLAAANNYGGDFSIAFDESHVLTEYFQGTMGITIVIDSSNVVRMLEDYKDGGNLSSVLSGL